MLASLGQLKWINKINAYIVKKVLVGKFSLLKKLNRINI